ADRRAPEGNQPRQDRHRGRARHGLRARARRQGHLPARGIGACGRHHRPGLGQRPGRRSLSGALSMLNVSNIDLHYGAAQALRGISLKAEPGKVTCVLGRNGVGKTSLLRAIIGQHPISKGTITLGGADITKLSTVERARSGVALVPQGREIFPLLTVEENLQTGFAPLPRSERDVPDDVFSLFPVLNSMIGRALVMRPKLLLLDEPTEGIQPSIIKDIGRAITYLRGIGEMAIVLVEQYLDFARELGDHFAVMERGSIVYACDKAGMDEGALKRALAI